VNTTHLKIADLRLKFRHICHWNGWFEVVWVKMCFFNIEE